MRHFGFIWRFSEAAVPILRGVEGSARPLCDKQEIMRTRKGHPRATDNVLVDLGSRMRKSSRRRPSWHAEHMRLASRSRSDEADHCRGSYTKFVCFLV